MPEVAHPGEDHRQPGFVGRGDVRMLQSLTENPAGIWFNNYAAKSVTVRNADIQGLRVHTGLDPVVQRAARDALVAQIQRVEAGEFGGWFPGPAAATRRPEPPGSWGSARTTRGAEGAGAGIVVAGRVVMDRAHSSRFSGRGDRGTVAMPVVGGGVGSGPGRPSGCVASWRRCGASPPTRSTSARSKTRSR